MADNRNTFIAIALSLVVLLGWQYFVARPQLEQAQQAAQQQAEAQQAGTPAPGATPGAASGTAGVPGSAGEATGPLSREQAIASAPRVSIETPRLSGSISLTGARVDDLRLKDYRETVDKDSPLITLFSPKGTQGAFYADNGWVAEPGAQVKLPGADTVWTVAGESNLTPGTPVTLTWDNGEGAVFSRTLSIDENYMFKVTQSVTNNTGADLTLYPYSLIVRNGTPHTEGFYILHEGLIGVTGDEGLQEIKYKTLAEDGKTMPAKANRGWVGFTDKYWAATVAPEPGTSFQPSFSYNKATDNFQADYLGDAVSIAAGSTQEASTYLFAGAKETKLLASYEESIGIDRFDLLIDWGWFYFLTKPMFYVIDWLFHLVGNFGIAILLVTVLVKAIFFPLANKSYVSMSK
ncbi:MAG: membrane protein insertase YidC, partial [Pannonibacter phragmitetus]